MISVPFPGTGAHQRPRAVHRLQLHDLGAMRPLGPILLSTRNEAPYLEAAEKAAGKKRERAEKQASVIPILAVSEVEYISSIKNWRSKGYISVAQIDEQLEWLFLHGVKCISKAKSGRGDGRAGKLLKWIEGIKEYVDSGVSRSAEADDGDTSDDEENLGERDEDDIIAAVLEDDDGYDSEEDYYK
ncbi:hypothetical protein CYLTODRAFT_494623 [Cylindrobasidium torrendii FP15055 ss-10]|uniref:Uncharacterized protein n=1 Tax=Cylindrobasidium torrendii FP15055 ss-10 TaxID=1314674 RepID=A0A0D7AYU9_9AGAR|nr:hypothetical protein CYLTODRAFT_494623 [Cylindrobasidium torrendii FP15055 ss-10]